MAVAVAAPTAERAGRWRLGVRARILGVVLGLAALAMAVAGGTTVVLQLANLDQRVESRLATEVSDFRKIAVGGVNPITQRRYADVSGLLEVAIQLQAPDAEQTFLAVVDGRPLYTPRGERPLRLEDQPGIVSVVTGLGPADPVVIRDADTSAGAVRYAAVPVSIAGQPSTGVYVVAYDLTPARAEIASGARRFALVAAVCLALVGLVGWLVAGRLLRPLRLLRRTALRISHADLSERIPVTGADDVSELARTFNEMLDRLEAGAGAQRQFLDDAGHELRTPVTIVRGHLELMDAHDPREVADTRALALDELDRMARLVDDLILLTKARRPDFLRPCVVDLHTLTVETLEKARALGPRDWRLDAHGAATFMADPQRLTQALLELARNAVTATRPGTVVALGSAADELAVRLWVRDEGPGVAEQDAVRIFDRFARVADGRGDGAGLGLAIVAAIADAHGGRVDLVRPDSGGAQFCLVLPREPGEALPTTAADGARRMQADRHPVQEAGV